MSQNPDSLFTTFDYPFDAMNNESIETYEQAMKDLRDKASKTPLDPTSVFSLKLRLTAQNTANSRPIPWFAAEATDEERTYSCRLLEPLRVGPDKLSQVWIAQVLRDEDKLESESIQEDPKIVLKILQQSLSIIPTVEGINAVDGTYVYLEEYAKNEDLAYCRVIKDLQGTYVPYYYGLHEITTPSGEPAWAIALEYIEGQNFEQLGRTCKLPMGVTELDEGKLNTLCTAYDSATKTIRAIQDRDVHQMDKKADNFIVMPDSNFVVGIDFAVTEFSMYPEERIAGMLLACQNLIDCFGDYQDAVQLWVDEHLDPEFRGYTDVDLFGENKTFPDEDNDGLK